MRFRAPEGARPVARIELYSSLRKVKRRQVKGLAGIRASARRKPPRRGIALRIEVDIPVAKATRPWHIELTTGPTGCWQCMRAALHEAAKAAEAKTKAAYIWREGNGHRSTAYVHLVDGAGNAKEARQASAARRVAAQVLMSLGYTVAEVDDAGDVRVHPPVAKWLQHADCKLTHGPRPKPAPTLWS